jgi:WD40 repeat protein
MNVKSLAVDPLEDVIVSGSNEGSVKAWDLPSLNCREHWEDVHMKHTFVRKPGVFEAPVSTYGVMQVMLTTKYLFSCGSDGRTLRTEISRVL